MDITQLKRDKERVLAAVKINRKEHSIVAKEEFRIMVPKHYLNGKLGILDNRYNLAGFLCYVAGDSYCVSMAHTMLPFEPDVINVVKIGDVEYLELIFYPGSIICPNTITAQKKTLVFEIYDEIVAKGKMPWYLGYPERVELFKTAKKFAGVNLKGSHSLMSVFAAACARNPKDRTQLARETFKTQADYANPALVDYIPLRSVAYGADNTTSRLMGSYLKVGITSSLVNPSEQTEDIENLLRS